MSQASPEYMEYLRLDEEGRIAEANIKLNEAVRARDPLALHTRAYEAEENDPPKMDEALRLYRMAAARGYEPSIMNLARHYEGLGNARRYLFWLRKAAAMGSPDAIAELNRPFPYLVSRAVSDLNHGGRVQDAIRAFKMAARHGSIDARVNLANIYDLKCDPPRRALARKLYKSAVASGSGLAAYNLANHYSDIGDDRRHKEYMAIARKIGY